MPWYDILAGLVLNLVLKCSKKSEAIVFDFSLLIIVLHFNRMYYVCTDYVDEIWNDILGMSKEKRKSVAEKYSAKVPQPLNSQFPNRAKKNLRQ